jgi:hypothetical protein
MDGIPIGQTATDSGRHHVIAPSPRRARHFTTTTAAGSAHQGNGSHRHRTTSSPDAYAHGSRRPQQHFPFCWTGGHGTEPYEQNTQQSPGLGFSRWPQPLQS